MRRGQGISCRHTSQHSAECLHVAGRKGPIRRRCCDLSEGGKVGGHDRPAQRHRRHRLERCHQPAHRRIQSRHAEHVQGLVPVQSRCAVDPSGKDAHRGLQAQLHSQGHQPGTADPVTHDGAPDIGPLSAAQRRGPQQHVEALVAHQGGDAAHPQAVAGKPQPLTGIGR